MEIHEPIDRGQYSDSQKSSGKIGLILELMLAICSVAGILITDVLGFPRLFGLGLTAICLLGFMYFLGNWWLNKPFETSARTILITILFGVTSFALTFAIAFRWMYLPGEDGMRIISLGLLVTSVIVDAVTSFNKTKVSNPRTKWRFTVLACIIVLYMLIGDNRRIHFSYRNYPEFIQYYEQHKDSKEFTEIEKEFFGE